MKDTVTIEVPRSALTVTAPAPLTVSQRTSLATFGLPPKSYLALARAGAFPVARIGALRVAQTDHVKAALAALAAPAERAKPAESTDVDEILRDAGYRKKAG